MFGDPTFQIPEEEIVFTIQESTVIARILRIAWSEIPQDSDEALLISDFIEALENATLIRIEDEYQGTEETEEDGEVLREASED